MIGDGATNDAPQALIFPHRRRKYVVCSGRKGIIIPKGRGSPFEFDFCEILETLDAAVI
jgi:hypothetical protein